MEHSFIAHILEKIRSDRPLVHNITNLVVMDISANALLALGASPVMAHAPEEVQDMTALARALVLNIGTLSTSWVESMRRALQAAKEHQIPVVLDPVGAGATAFRTQTARMLIVEGPPTIIRGNASEISALRGASYNTKGVDSSMDSGAALDAALELAKGSELTIVISGPVDYVLNRERGFRVLNGHPIMTKVTGLGCVASALCGACIAVWKDPLQASTTAMAICGVAAEMAAEKCLALNGAQIGPGSFRVHFVDALSAITAEELIRRAKIEGC